MSLSTARDVMTEREREEFNQEKEAAEIQSTYNLKVKEMDLEVAKMEARFSSWMKIPIVIITLPVRILFAIAVIVSAATKKDLPKEFWDYMKK